MGRFGNNVEALQPTYNSRVSVVASRTFFPFHLPLIYSPQTFPLFSSSKSTQNQIISTIQTQQFLFICIKWISGYWASIIHSSTLFTTLVVDMPGLKSGDIKVQVEEDNVLVVSGERKREEDKEGVKYVRMERKVGKFMRKFALPENANLENINAVCQDGVLSVTVQKLPPPEPKKPKTIEVKTA
ncbi:17.3 kDa class II heat shock protein-like [Apium graveolens]|uniref:17.3 kDa class II heat shock protein-like n=1 Tax=Apium graveolens TaxID=4045 RepID=UPI003D799997